MSQKKSIFKRWWFWVIIGVVFLGIIGAISPSEEDSSLPDNTDRTTASDQITSGVILGEKDPFSTDTAVTDSTTDTATASTTDSATASSSASSQTPASSQTQASTSTTSNTGTTSDTPTSNSGSASGGSAAVIPDNNEEKVEYVWIPNYEKGKYHCSPDCSGMKSPIKVTKEEAIRLGFQPCQRKNCYG